MSNIWRNEKRKLKQAEQDLANEALAIEADAKNERYRYLPDSWRAFDDLSDVVGSEAASTVKALIEAMIAEARPSED
ncbi:MAG: hypothetical protein ACAH27_05895 [Xanthobacteraceae bacterium]